MGELGICNPAVTKTQIERLHVLVAIGQIDPHSRVELMPPDFTQKEPDVPGARFDGLISYQPGRGAKTMLETAEQ